MQMVPWMVVALSATSRAVRSDATAVNGTETNTETLSGTRTPNTVTSTGTPTSTPTSVTLGFSVCLGDAEAFNAGYGNCGTYTPPSGNSNFCHLDSDNDGLLAQQVCPQCGLCYLNYTTTGTSTGTSSTSLHTTTDTTSTTTPHTTTETDTATATPFACLGDAGVFETPHGNCSTYAPELQTNFAWCHLDSDSEGLLAEQVCPECGLCYLVTSTTSAHTTTGTSTGTSSTSVYTATDTTSTTTPHTTTETDTATASPFACLGDAGVFETPYGNCSTYAPELHSNFAWCYLDSDIEGLFAEQVCPECGLCYLVTSTTSAHTTTGTSTETSTTSVHTTTGTSTSTTPHTTTGTDTTTYTQAPCSRAVEVVARAVDWGGECVETVNGTCPATCLPVLEDAIAVCDGAKNTIGRYPYAYQGGPVASLLGFSEGACREVFVDALLSSTVYTPDCLDGLILLSAPISSCYGDDNMSACPELCERAMDVAFDRCSDTDVIAFGDEVLSAGQLADFASEGLSDQCFAVLSTKTFLGAGVTSTAMAGDKSAAEEWASTTVDHGTGSVNGSFVGTSSSGATAAMSSSSTSGGGSAVAEHAEETEEEEEVLSSSHKSGACLLVLLLACLLTLE